jgi:hypothetical protein
MLKFLGYYILPPLKEFVPEFSKLNHIYKAKILTASNMFMRQNDQHST